eukprot:962067-Karenia_brevis.AAC.1
MAEAFTPICTKEERVRIAGCDKSPHCVRRSLSSTNPAPTPLRGSAPNAVKLAKDCESKNHCKEYWRCMAKA